VRRVFWLAVGLGAGVTVGLMVTRWAHRKTEQLAPGNLGRQAVEALGDLGKVVREAAGEFRAGMVEKEAEIRATLGE
jgi:hypothetical protein